MAVDTSISAGSGRPARARLSGDGLPDGLRELGPQIRALRLARGLTSAALARHVGVSTSLISQIERDVTSPSLAVLWGIARALDVSIGAFFRDPAFQPKTPPSGKATVVRSIARKLLGLPNSITYELLSPDLHHQIELIWVRFEPGEESPPEPYVHPGEEQMVVIEGEMHYIVDGEEYVLREGDAITFDSALPHRALNRSDRPAVIIAAITPPSF